MPSFAHVTMYMYLTLQNLDAIIGVTSQISIIFDYNVTLAAY